MLTLHFSHIQIRSLVLWHWNVKAVSTSSENNKGKTKCKFEERLILVLYYTLYGDQIRAASLFHLVWFSSELTIRGTL